MILLNEFAHFKPSGAEINLSIGEQYKIKSYQQKINDLYYLDEEMLKDYLVKLCELDYKIKQGLVDKSTMLQLFILDKDK